MIRNLESSRFGRKLKLNESQTKETTNKRILHLERKFSLKNEEESDYTSDLSNSISLKLGKIREIVSLLEDDVANYCDIMSDKGFWSDWKSFRDALSKIDYM